MLLQIARIKPEVEERGHPAWAKKCSQCVLYGITGWGILLVLVLCYHNIKTLIQTQNQNSNPSSYQGDDAGGTESL